MKSINRILLATAAFTLTSVAHATETGFFNLIVEKVLFQSDNAANVGQRGEVWIKVNSSITTLNAGCPTTNWYNNNGYLVAAYQGDEHRNQIIAGLLAAKAAGQTINGAVEDSKKNVSGICTLSWFEVQ